MPWSWTLSSGTKRFRGDAFLKRHSGGKRLELHPNAHSWPWCPSCDSVAVSVRVLFLPRSSEVICLDDGCKEVFSAAVCLVDGLTQCSVNITLLPAWRRLPASEPTRRPRTSPGPVAEAPTSTHRGLHRGGDLALQLQPHLALLGARAHRDRSHQERSQVQLLGSPWKLPSAVSPMPMSPFTPAARAQALEPKGPGSNTNPATS